MKSRQCPLCQGKGILYDNPIEISMQTLRKNGMTIRQIAGLVGKSPTAVHYHLHKYDKQQHKKL